MNHASYDPDATVPASAFALSALAASRMLAELAIERAVRRDETGSRAAIEDALVMLEAVEDRVEAARVGVVLGEALLALRDSEAARERFEASFLTLLSLSDREGSSRAVLGVARALQMRGDVRARNAFAYAELLHAEAQAS